jgi:hypothetical protein
MYTFRYLSGTRANLEAIGPATIADDIADEVIVQVGNWIQDPAVQERSTDVGHGRAPNYEVRQALTERNHRSQRRQEQYKPTDM